MASIANGDPNIQSALNAYQQFYQDPDLRIFAEKYDDMRYEAEAYGDAREAKGIAKGRAEGRAEGEVKGKAEGKNETLILILTKRLGVLPEELTAKLTALTDIAEIDRLTNTALDVPTLDDFMKNL